MRKLLTILALWGLSTGFAALTASADTVTYTVDGTFSAIPNVPPAPPFPPFPSTALSNPNDVFTLTFSVPSDLLGTMPIGNNTTPGSPVTFDYKDLTTGFSLSETCNTPTSLVPCLSFFTPTNGGLFSITFTGPNGNIFMFELNALGCFGSSSASPATCGGFTDGTPPTMQNPQGTPPTLNTGGPFTIDNTGFSFLGEFNPGPNGGAVGGNDISGTVTATSSTTPVPEPSSLLLLGSGLLALSGFARKRLITRLN
jgi:hypothetical protein